VSEYQFTKDWFGWAPPVWEQLIPMLPHGVERSFLEIGSFEGRSMVWIVENMMNPGDELICVDTWEGGEEHGAEDMGTVEKRFRHNHAIAITKNDVSVLPHKGLSTEYFGAAIAEGDDKITFDFIYIDGSHIAKDVLTDACMAWPLLKPKGLMVFDDYMWGNPRDILHRPKPAIDAFTNIFAEEAEIIHVGYQLVVRKK
jgi:predicted O-methyltransferase YrrM